METIVKLKGGVKMNHLKFYRKGAGLTLAELSEKTGIPESTINRVERGIRDINGQSWKVLAKALGCSIDELLGK